MCDLECLQLPWVVNLGERNRSVDDMQTSVVKLVCQQRQSRHVCTVTLHLRTREPSLTEKENNAFALHALNAIVNRYSWVSSSPTSVTQRLAE